MLEKLEAVYRILINSLLHYQFVVCVLSWTLTGSWALDTHCIHSILPLSSPRASTHTFLPHTSFSLYYGNIYTHNIVVQELVFSDTDYSLSTIYYTYPLQFSLGWNQIVPFKSICKQLKGGELVEKIFGWSSDSLIRASGVDFIANIVDN